MFYRSLFLFPKLRAKQLEYFIELLDEIATLSLAITGGLKNKATALKE